MKRLLASTLTVIILGIVGLLLVRFEIHKIRSERNAAANSLHRQDYRITIPEGWRREEIAQILEKSQICSATDFLRASTGEEGYLFPDTYRFFRNTPASEVVSTMTADFTKRTSALNPTKEQVILASIIEREAKYDAERAPIAGVYTNRLRLGMNLEADPTVQYARDNRDSVGMLNDPLTSTPYIYWKPITQADYKSITSPYNTYLNNGLPPGPIDNPGLPSITAAINPASSNYLYFFQKNGNIYLSKTITEHLAKLQQVR